MTNKPNAAVTGRGARGTEQLGKADGLRVAHRVNHEQACQHCGEEIRSGKRLGRKAIYCSPACKHRAFRRAKWVGRYGLPDLRRNASKNTVVSSTCNGSFAGRGSVPIEVLGHASFRWPGTLDRALIRKIVRTEIGIAEANT